MKRALKREVGAEAQEKMTDQIAQFSKLPDRCDVCSAGFNKKDHKMIDSWMVVVRQEVVRLFCPDCVDKTKEALDNGGN